MPQPSGDLGVTIELAHELIRWQRPDLIELPLRPFAHGWDNETFALGDRLLVRIPRRASAAALVRAEQRWLPGLAAGLPVAVPVPLFAGAPSEIFEHHWSIVPRLDGVVLSEVPIERRGRVADQLADFLLALHRIAPPDAPLNPFRGVPLAQRGDAVLERVSRLGESAAAVRTAWQNWSAAENYSGPPLWLHGDPHPLNVLADSDGRLAAVLDWGDLTAGDPASDLAAGWLAFVPADRRRFFARYVAESGCDPSTLTRAKAWALNLATAFLAADDPQLVPIARHALAELLAEA